MSFGAELKDFTAAMTATYGMASDRRDKKEERERNARNDRVDNDYKDSVTEGNKKKNKWYDVLTEEGLADSRSSRAARDKTTEWADRDYESLHRSRESQSDYQRAGIFDRVFNKDAGEAPPERLDDFDEGGSAIDTTTTGSIDQASDWLKYDNQNATRNKPVDPKLQNALSFLPDMGVSMVVFSGGQDAKGKGNRRTGSTRHDEGVGAADVFFEKNGRRLDWAREEDQPIFAEIVRKARKRGVGGIGAGDGYMQPGSVHLGFGAPAVWGRGGNSKNAPEWLRTAYAGYSRGGLVQHASLGGPISALPLDEEEDELLASEPQPVRVAQAQALPVDGPIPEERPVTSEGIPSTDSEDPAKSSDPRVAGFDKAHQAVMEGINYSLNEMGLSGGAAVQDPDRAARMSAYLKGQGAATPSIIQQAYEAVDPDNELPESERTMAALAKVHDYYTRKGEPEKAQKAAASIVQYQRVLFQRYAAIAQAAVSEGDMDGGVEAAVRAYSTVPDGRDIKVNKLEDGRYAVEFTDEATGKVVSKPVLTPDEMGAFAMQVSPASFDEFILSAAGQKAEKATGPSEQFQAIVTGMDEGVMPSNKDMAALDLEEQREIRIRAKEINDAAGGVGGEDAPKAVTNEQLRTIRGEIQESGIWEQMMETPDPEDPEKLMYPGMDSATPEERSDILDAAADIAVHTGNRSGEASISDLDAVEVAAFVAFSREFKASEPKDGKVVVTTVDGRNITIPVARFKRLDRIYKLRKADADKAVAEDATARKINQRDDRAAAGDRITDRNNRIADRRNNGRVTPQLPAGGALGFGSRLAPQSALPIDLPPEVIDKTGETQSTMDKLQELLGW